MERHDTPRLSLSSLHTSAHIYTLMHMCLDIHACAHTHTSMNSCVRWKHFNLWSGTGSVCFCSGRMGKGLGTHSTLLPSGIVSDKRGRWENDQLSPFLTQEQKQRSQENVMVSWGWPLGSSWILTEAEKNEQVSGILTLFSSPVFVVLLGHPALCSEGTSAAGWLKGIVIGILSCFRWRSFIPWQRPWTDRKRGREGERRGGRTFWTQWGEQD